MRRRRVGAEGGRKSPNRPHPKEGAWFETTRASAHILPACCVTFRRGRRTEIEHSHLLAFAQFLKPNHLALAKSHGIAIGMDIRAELGEGHFFMGSNPVPELKTLRHLLKPQPRAWRNTDGRNGRRRFLQKPNPKKPPRKKNAASWRASVYADQRVRPGQGTHWKNDAQLTFHLLLRGDWEDALTNNHTYMVIYCW